MTRERGPLRKIVERDRVEGYDGVYVESFSCGHARLVQDTNPSPKSGRRHCRDCRDGTDTRTRHAARYVYPATTEATGESR